MVLRDRYRFSGLRVDRRGLLARGGKPLGMVVPEEAGYVFHAAATELWCLDRQVFTSVEEAKRAAWDVLDNAESETSEETSDLGA